APGLSVDRGRAEERDSSPPQAATQSRGLDVLYGGTRRSSSCACAICGLDGGRRPSAQVIAMTKRQMDRAGRTEERALFDIPEDVVYLNCANMSPQLQMVTEAGRRAVEAKRSPWTLRSHDWFAPSEHLRAL